MPIKAVIFHLENTLVRPIGLDIDRIKTSIGCPVDETILGFLQSLTHSEDRSRILSSLDRIESEAAADSTAETNLRARVDDGTRRSLGVPPVRPRRTR